jgi:ABC-type sulfate/molybdate transport systems ATPase subunit
MSLVKVEKISTKEERGFSLKAINFTQQKGQRLAVAGATGSGKSTLLKIIGGILQPAAGNVYFEGKRVPGPDEKLFPGHPHIAYLSQHFELRNNYWVEEELNYTNQLPLPEQDAAAIFDVCRISHLLQRKTTQLSGGERQRIVLARLLIARPKLLLLDEPFSNLDTVHKQVIKSVINDIGERLEITCMLVSHDPLDVLSWADEILVLKDGVIVQKGSPEQVYGQPVNEYTAGLFGPFNSLSTEQAAAFGIFTGAHSNGKRFVVRPEQMTINNEKSSGIKAIVQQSRFFGSYYEVEVAVMGQLLTIKTIGNGWKKGDEVFISLPVDAVMLID